MNHCAPVHVKYGWLTAARRLDSRKSYQSDSAYWPTATIYVRAPSLIAHYSFPSAPARVPRSSSVIDIVLHWLFTISITISGWICSNEQIRQGQRTEEDPVKMGFIGDDEKIEIINTGDARGLSFPHVDHLQSLFIALLFLLFAAYLIRRHCLRTRKQKAALTYAMTQLQEKKNPKFFPTQPWEQVCNLTFSLFWEKWPFHFQNLLPTFFYFFLFYLNSSLKIFIISLKFQVRTLFSQFFYMLW